MENYIFPTFHFLSFTLHNIEGYFIHTLNFQITAVITFEIVLYCESMNADLFPQLSTENRGL